VYRLRRSSPLVVAADAPTTPASAAAVGAAVTAVARTKVVVSVRRPGRYLVKFTWTPYWRLSAPPGVPAGAASLSAAPGDWIALRAPQPGRYVLRVRPSLHAALARIF
jgi:hypothetical protein